MRVRYRPAAFAQLLEIIAKIESDSPHVASSFANRVDALLALTARHPDIGRKTARENVRVIPARPYPYLIFYVADPEGLTVLRIRHMARDEDWRTGR